MKKSVEPTVGVEAILFATPDPMALAGFYQRAFGFPAPHAQGDEHVGVMAGNTYLGFDRVRDDEQGGRGAMSLWFGVADTAATFQKLVELGATAKMKPDATCSPGETLATVLDPDGNVVGLLGPGPKPKKKD
jgi:predicted enzyme related to lactoylglutathione lyase